MTAPLDRIKVLGFTRYQNGPQGTGCSPTWGPTS